MDIGEGDSSHAGQGHFLDDHKGAHKLLSKADMWTKVPRDHFFHSRDCTTLHILKKMSILVPGWFSDSAHLCILVVDTKNESKVDMK